MKFKSNVELEALSNATTDTDRFIVSDSNTLKYRTGSQVLSDIGGQASLTNPVTGTGTLNFVSKFTSTGSTLGNSLIYDNGTYVGIGTTSPGAKLDIRTSSDQAIFASTDGGYNALEFTSDSGTTTGSLIAYNNTIRLGNASGVGGWLNGIVIDSAGNVGIGTTSPGFKLDVSGNGIRNIRTTAGWAGWFENTGSSSGVIVTAGVDSGDAPLLIRKQDGTELFSVRGNGTSWFNGGNVGIGTTSPSAIGGHSGILTLYGSNATALVLRDVVSEGHLRFDDSNFKFTNSNGDVRVQIETDTGNVGIGTTSPGAKLDIGGDVRTSTRYLITTGAANQSMAIGYWDGVNARVEAGSALPMLITSYQGNIKLGINGGTTMTIQSSNVGIGTTSPSAKLHVYSGLSGATVNANADDFIIESNTNAGISILGDGNETQYLMFGDASNSAIGRLTYNHVDDSMGLFTNATEKMRITSAGNVGIGTTNPGYKLDVNNTSAGNLTTALTLNNGSTTTNTAVALRLQTDPTSTVNSYSEIRSTRTNSPAAGGVAMQFLVTNSTTGAASEIMRLSYAGLGLGTAGTTTITDTRRGAFADGTAAAPAYSFSDDTNNGMYRITTDTLGFSTAGSEKLRISSAGNVGIGTTNPSEKLDVNGNLIVSGNFNNLYVGGKTDSNVDGIRMLCAGDDSFIDCRGGSGLNFRLDDTTGDTQRIKFHSGGNVSIGNTNNSYKLDVTGTGNFAGNLQISTGDQQTTRLLLKNTSSTGGRTFALVGGIHNVTQDGFSIYDTVAAATRLAILNTGNVGIGNTNDTYKLDVSGTGRFTSTVTATNFILSSDKTLKDNISDINTDHVDVKWKNFELKSEPGVKRAGVVAQELEEKHPEFVRTDKDGIKSVAYIDLLIAKIAELEARLEKLEK
jgi:hypothetical protein